MVHATTLADLIDLAHLAAPNFAQELGGGEMWGGAGSVTDGVGLRGSLEPVDADTERDGLELMQLLIRLADHMKQRGISSEGSEFVADAFRRGLEMLGSEEPEP